MNICLIFQKSQKQFELEGISQASSSHRSNTGSIAKTCSRSNGSTSKSSTSGNVSHRGGGNSNGSSVGDSGLNGDRDLGAGSPWDLLGNRGAHLPRDGHTDRVGDLTRSLNVPGVAHPPGLGMAVGGRGVTSNKRSSSRGVSSSVESIGLSLRLGISLSFTLANTVVGQTDAISSTTNSSNAGHTGSVSDNV